MPHYTIQPLRGGSFAEAETSLLYYLADDRNAGLKIPAVYWMYLIRGEGACLLVDTGPGAPDTWRQYHHDFQRTPEEEPVRAVCLRVVKGRIPRSTRSGRRAAPAG